MLKDALVYLFSNSMSRIDSLLLTTTIILFINDKYKYGVILLILGIPMVEVAKCLLNI